MPDISENYKKSTDPAVRQMISKAEKLEVKTVWDRCAAPLIMTQFQKRIG